MKTYQIKVYNPLITGGLVLSSVAILTLANYYLTINHIKISQPYFYLVGFISFYICYKLSEGIMTITLMGDDTLEIRTKEKPTIGYIKDKDIKLSDIESYRYWSGRGGHSLTIYLYNAKKVRIILWWLTDKTDKDNFFLEFRHIISRYNKKNHPSIVEKINIL